MRNTWLKWAFIIALIAAWWPAAGIPANEKAAVNAQLPAEDEDWTFTLSGFAGTPSDRSYVEWTLTQDGIFKRQKGYQKPSDPEQCQLTPEDIHQLYVNIGQMIKKENQNTRPSEGDGWIVTMKLASKTAELSKNFHAANFADIAKKHPEFNSIEMIIGKQTFKKATSKRNSRQMTDVETRRFLRNALVCLGKGRFHSRA